MGVPEDRGFGAVLLRECGEPLVDVRAVAPLRVAAGPPIHLRSGVVDRLVVVQSLLPRAVRLLVLAGHCPPQHPTGAAADLALCDDGGTPVENPPLLAGALGALGFVPAAGWWHWTYGDRYWAFVTGAPYARYGPVPSATAGR